MNLEPPESFLAKRLGLGELEDSTVEVGAHMIEMRWDGVHSASEVHVMGEEDLVAGLETLGHSHSEQELASETMLLFVLLVLLKQLELLAEACFSDHLWGN